MYIVPILEVDFFEQNLDFHLGATEISWIFVVDPGASWKTRRVEPVGARN